MKEIWKDIIEYKDKYQISNLGNVRYKKDKKTLKQYECRKYKYVSLYDNGKAKNIRVHRLVAKAFLKDFTDNCIVMHLDNNPANNNVKNLKCGTQSDNMQQCVRDKRFYYLYKKVNQYDLDGKFIKQWKSQTDIQKELGYRQNMISMCCKGIKKNAYGYIWRYVKENKNG